MDNIIKLDNANTNFGSGQILNKSPKNPIILNKKIYFLTGNKNKISEIIDYCLRNTEYMDMSNHIGFISMELEEIQCENSSDLKVGSDQISKNKIQKAVWTIDQMVAKNIIKITSDEVIFVCEDTSLYMNDTINSFPGPYIKFMMPSDIINFANGIEFRNKKSDSRKAFVSSQFSFINYSKLKLYDDFENINNMSKIEVVCGTTQGRISNELRGIDGWSFDLCFIPCIEEFEQSQLFSKYCETNPNINIHTPNGKTYSELMDMDMDMDIEINADTKRSCRLKNCVSHRTKALDNFFSQIKKFNLI